MTEGKNVPRLLGEVAENPLAQSLLEPSAYDDEDVFKKPFDIQSGLDKTEQSSTAMITPKKPQ